MADENDISKIISNYKSMSMGDLANNLLSRQDRISKANKRTAHRADKVNKILGVLLGTQAVFNKNAQARLAEIDAGNLVLGKKNEKLLDELQIVGRTLKEIPVEMINSATAYQDFLKDRKVQTDSRNNLYNIISNQLKEQDPDGWEAAGKDLTRQVHLIHDTIVMKHFLEVKDGKRSPAQILLEKGVEFFEGDKDAKDVFEELYAFRMSDIEDRQNQRVSRAKKNIRNKSSILGIPSLIKGMFNGDESVFKAMETGDWKGSSIGAYLEDEIITGDFISPDFAEVMSSWQNNKNYINQAMADKILMDGSSAGRAGTGAIRHMEDLQKNMNEGPTSLETIWYKDSTKRWKAIEEVKAVLEAMFTPEGGALAYDITMKRELLKTWGGLRLLLDDEGAEGYNLIKEQYKVDIGAMDDEEKDTFAMGIVLSKGIGMTDPTAYGGRGWHIDSPNYDDNIAGHLELYSPDNPRAGAFSRDSIQDRKSNFIDTFSEISVYLDKPTIKSVDPDGRVELSDAANLALNNKNSAGVAGQEIEKDLTKVEYSLGREQAENLREALLSNNQGYRNAVAGTYSPIPIAGASNIPIPQAIIPNNLSYGENLAAKGEASASASLQEEIIGPAVEGVKTWRTGLREEAFVKDIIKYYESPGTTPFQVNHRREDFEKALAGLNITEQTAEDKYSMVE